MNNNYMGEDYIIIKALENGVTIIGLTRGKDTKFHHTEKLDKGEVMILQFTEHTSAMKIRGHAEIISRYGTVTSEHTSGSRNS
ncbi:MAG TPA: trp RNA-binding attenuation protein MtrB [Syntrophomonadaceae bacterium]|nr:trp RNA-binding attenuation protein MtrB [Syntrophomonadaceae bacterium]HQA07483.1 trp RNA-binding attenuation protein MtrB [Syntrophomonadaceae bacterium]HQE23279.1 trp RNA-binding attenuation protein MtrB [Syntrophomonadaceae bacterium]